MMIFLIVLAVFFLAMQTISLRELEADGIQRHLLATGVFTGAIALAFLLALVCQGFSVSWQTMVFGTLFGIVFVATVTAYYYAMRCGPLSYTTFFYSSSMAVPVVTGLFLWGERLTLQTGVGILLFMAAFYCISVLGGRQENKANCRWVVLCFSCWLCNGLLSVLMKQHQMLTGGREYLEVLTVSFFTASILSLMGSWLLRRQVSGGNLAFVRRWKWPLFGAALGSGAGNIIITYLSSRLPSGYLFPLVLGGVVMAVTIYSLTALKEKLNRSGIVGLALGLAAIIIVNL